MELRKRLLHPHYVAHALFASVYLIARFARPSWIQASGELQDHKSLLILLGLSAWKYAVSCTAEELVSVITLYCKTYSVIMLFSYGKPWWALIYGACWIGIFMLLPQPPYLGSSKVLELTLDSANKILRTADEQPKIVELDDDDEPLLDVPKAQYWVVLVYANWSVASRNFEAVLAQLSLKYDGKNVKFGKIDIEFYPTFAAKYGVSGEAAAFDLPTLILFKDGDEFKRLPELSSSKRAAKGKTSAPELSRKDAAKDTINRIGWNRSPVSD
ncbi:hypothetical protein K450DRAFT_217220 [Umbelopsis ramanniana AG]|uniref:Thioredoxin domain-containing protein n=1 Tax=Umbelopsis ramanniana AG TaxID=1314678 RepID=A0AAD5EJJ8_UMBRA|nr:uncharacterized protein K450DRAFT_217220 [Umbelopsis ramanniana AG]KAI8584632.1 hypothetical protein K450DRAFT_217220 [Umbelopsis ramanniana AG]